MPEFQQFVIWALQALLAAFGAVLWSNYRDLLAKVERLTEDHARFREHIASNYVTQVALTELFRALRNQLDRIEQKLDQKQDKE